MVVGAKSERQSPLQRSTLLSFSTLRARNGRRFLGELTATQAGTVRVLCVRIPATTATKEDISFPPRAEKGQRGWLGVAQRVKSSALLGELQSRERRSHRIKPRPPAGAYLCKYGWAWFYWIRSSFPSRWRRASRSNFTRGGCTPNQRRVPLFCGSPSAARFLSPAGKETRRRRERAEKARRRGLPDDSSAEIAFGGHEKVKRRTRDPSFLIMTGVH